MADLTYKQLQQAVTDLGRDVARSGEAIHTHAQKIDEDAKDTSRVAEMIAAIGVDTATIAETRELSKNTNGLGEAALAYASAADNTAKAARAAHDQARASHGGIHEAYSRAPVDISNMRPDWLRQE